jgi:hypothetical protein
MQRWVLKQKETKTVNIPFNSGEREPLSSLLPSIGREILSSAQSPTQLERNFTQKEKTISRHTVKRDG